MTTAGFDANQALPPLRQSLEAIQVEQDGKPIVVLHDQEGLNDQSVAVTLPGFLLAMMLNGQNTLADVQTGFSKATGAMVSPEEIKALISQLEKSDLLETPAVQEKRKNILKQFMSATTRKAVHGGGAYPENLLELASFMGKFFQDAQGPGKQLSSAPLGVPPVGLIAPHIDLHRGGAAYAWAYQALSETPPPDVIVSLGVAHMSPNSPWVFTKKDYETPYGPMKVHNGLYDELASALWYNPVADEWVHRREHSLEFQALWLKYLWKEKAPAWVPILCSSFDRFCTDRAPSTVTSVDEALLKMGGILKAHQDKGLKVLVLAGVDLAHVGPRFGDELQLGPELEKKVEGEDRISLDHAMKLEADKFYMSVVADDHWRKVCGLSATYSGLRLISALAPDSRGKLLSYGQAPDPMGGLVSFASAVFPRTSLLK